MAFAALPESVTTRYFRGDSACYESNLLDWLSSPERAQEPGGRIGFAVNAVMSPQLAQTIAALPEAEWTSFASEPDGTLRQWAEVVYVPLQEIRAQAQSAVALCRSAAAEGAGRVVRRRL